MPSYEITLVIELDADSPKEAAEEALRIQRSDSDAVVFSVCNQETDEETYIDLE